MPTGLAELDNDSLVSVNPDVIQVLTEAKSARSAYPLLEMLQIRVADPPLLRLLGKCLHVGVLDDRAPRRGALADYRQ